jgi:hypothetical protein
MDRNVKSDNEEIPPHDWFDEVAEGENELKDEGAGLKDTVVEGFGKDVSREAIVEDSSTIGHVRPCCDDTEGTGMLPSTLLGSITPVVDLEGEYKGSGTTCEALGGNGPDLDVFENPWIDDVTMEWSDHANTLRTSAEVVSHSLDRSKGEGGYCGQPKEGEDTPNLRVVESCDVGVIGMTKDLEGPEMVSAICVEDPLVPRFEGEEDDRCETMDSPVAECHPSPIEFPNAEVFECALKSMFGRVEEGPPNILNPLVDCVKFVEGLETRHDASTTRIPRFEPFSVVGNYEKGQGGDGSVDGDEKLTLVDTVHLERPPRNVLVSVDSSAVKTFDLGDFSPKMLHERIEESLPSVANPPAGCVENFEGAETVEVEWVMSVAVVHHFGPFWAIGTGKGQIDVEELHRGGGLTLDNIAHLLRPPGWVTERRWWKETSSSLLIALVDACHMVLAHQVISVFSSSRRWTLCRFEGECWNK